MEPVAQFLIAVAAIFLIGAIGEIVFERTFIPDAIWLIATGVLLGPILGWVSKAELNTIAPYFAALTLVIVLFEGGSRIKLKELAKVAPRAGLLAILSFVFAVAVLTLVVKGAAGIGWLPESWTWSHAILVACILGGPSSIIIMPAMERAKLAPSLANLVGLESAITDAFCVVGTAAMIDIMVAGSEATSPGISLLKSFVGVRQASQVGQYVIGVWLLTLVPRLVVSLRQDALLVDPGAAQAKALAVMTVLLSLGVGWVSLVALSRGGQIQHFFRPIRATRRMVADLREAGWLDRTKERVTRFVAPLQPLQTFSLGLRAYLGAMVWLVLPTTLLAVGRKGGLAVLGGLLLVIVVLHLPFLQMHFAVHGNLRQMFDVRAVREGYRRAPVAYFVALLSTLLLAIPLYLLKVELVPRDALWLPAAVFVLTIFPTKLLTAWAYHRGGKRREPAHPLVVWGMRPPMVAVAALYAFAVFLSQFTGWHGILGLYEHHAFLLPVPF